LSVFLRSRNIRRDQKFRIWVFGLLIGYIGLGIFIFLLGELVNWIFIEGKLIIFSLIVTPVPIVGLIFLFDLYFPHINGSKNAGSEDTIRFCSERFFTAAKRSIMITTGSVNAPFYCDQRVINSLKNAQNRGVQIYITYPRSLGPTRESKLLDFLKEYKELFPVPKISGNHFMIVDGLHVRIEAPHGEPMNQKERENLKNDIHICSPILAWGLKQRFLGIVKNTYTNI